MKKIVSLLILIIGIFLYFFGVGNKEFQNRIFTKCKEDNFPRICQEKEVSEVLQKRGTHFAFVATEYLKKADPEFGPSCHGFVHGLGVSAYKMILEEKNVFAKPVSACDYGFYHGLMMEIAMHSRDDRNKGFALADKLCQRFFKLSNKDNSIYYQCYHGIGHGLPLAITDYRPESVASVLDQSLKYCDDYFDGKEFCKVGVYGGFVSFLTGEHNLRIEGFEVDDMLDICSRQDSSMKPYCYEMAAPALLFSFDDNVYKSVDAMNRAIAEDSDKILMARQIGQAILTYKYDATAQDLKSICGKVSGKSHYSCIEGFMNAFLDSRPDKNIKKTAEVFCKSANFDILETESCLGPLKYI